MRPELNFFIFFLLRVVRSGAMLLFSPQTGFRREYVVVLIFVAGPGER